jgi:hypothetical protein
VVAQKPPPTILDIFYLKISEVAGNLPLSDHKNGQFTAFQIPIDILILTPVNRKTNKAVFNGNTCTNSMKTIFITTKKLY